MLPQVDANGRIYAAPASTPVTWNGGVGYTADGRMCITSTINTTDSYLNGWRLDVVGRVVVSNQVAALAFNAGLPFNQTGSVGSMARQVDVAPAVGDPYVSGGIRVGPLGGAYMSTAIPP